MRRAVGVAFERDGRNGHGGKRRELVLDGIELRLALGQPSRQR
jgi:hypothetical protein